MSQERKRERKEEHKPDYSIPPKIFVPPKKTINNTNTSPNSDSNSSIHSHTSDESTQFTVIISSDFEQRLLTYKKKQIINNKIITTKTFKIVNSITKKVIRIEQVITEQQQ
eukprot:133678_1